MDSLPEEIIEKILRFLSPYREFDVAAQVCRSWRRIISGMEGNLNSILETNLRSDNLEWFEVEQTHQFCNVSMRSYQAMCYHDGSRSVYVFGGMTSTKFVYNTLLRLDMHSLAWERPVVNGILPPPMFETTLKCYKQFLLLFGGYNPSPSNLLGRGLPRFSNNLYVFDTLAKMWELKAFTFESCPPPISGAIGCVLDDDLDPEMIIMGGCVEPQRIGSRVKNSDIWCLSLTSWNWLKQEQVSSDEVAALLPKLWILHVESIQSTMSSCALMVLMSEFTTGHFTNAMLLYKSGFCEWTWQKISCEIDRPVSTSNPALTQCILIGKSLVLFEAVSGTRKKFKTIFPVIPQENQSSKPVSRTRLKLPNNIQSIKPKILEFQSSDLRITSLNGNSLDVRSLDGNSPDTHGGFNSPTILSEGLRRSLTQYNIVLGRGELIMMGPPKIDGNPMSLYVIRVKL